MRRKGIVSTAKYFLFFIILSHPSFAMWDEEKGFIPSFIQKCYGWYGKKDKLDEGEREVFIAKDASYKSSNSITKSQIENIDQDTFNIINDKINLTDTIYLSMVSKTLNKRFNDKYWKNYIKVNSLKKWSPLIPAIKVAYAYYSFQQGEVEKAAQLGLPEAVNSLKRKKEESPPRKKYIPFEYSPPYSYIGCGHPYSASSHFIGKSQRKYW